MSVLAPIIIAAAVIACTISTYIWYGLFAKTKFERKMHRLGYDWIVQDGQMHISNGKIKLNIEELFDAAGDLAEKNQSLDALTRDYRDVCDRNIGLERALDAKERERYDLQIKLSKIHRILYDTEDRE